MPRRLAEVPLLPVVEVTAPLELDLDRADDLPLAVVVTPEAPIAVVMVPDAPLAAVLPPGAPPVLVLAAATPIALVLGRPQPVAAVLEAVVPLPVVVLGTATPVVVVLGAAVPVPPIAGMITPIALVLEPTAPTSLDIRGVLRYLPHRYPMLLVDRIESLLPGVSATGIKCVTVNEPYMAGHFPGYPIMPGVLIVDALAQVAGIMLRSASAPPPAAGFVPDPKTRPGVLASIQRMRFLRQVLPGDRLSLKVRLLKQLGSLYQIAGEASVGGEVAAVGELVLAA